MQALRPRENASGNVSDLSQREAAAGSENDAIDQRQTFTHNEQAGRETAHKSVNARTHKRAKWTSDYRGGNSL